MSFNQGSEMSLSLQRGLSLSESQEGLREVTGNTRRVRISTHRTSTETSCSSSPERAADESTDFFMEQSNESVSSIGVPTLSDRSMSDTEEDMTPKSPVYSLPPEILIAVFAKLSSISDLRNCMLVSKAWATNSVELLWHRPLCNGVANMQIIIESITKARPYFAYGQLVKRLNMASMTEGINDGTLLPMAGCKRVERLTLTNCTNLTDLSVGELLIGNRNLLALDLTGVGLITDRSMMIVAENCKRLQGLNIHGCRLITDESMIAVSKNCKFIKRV
jgi:F-box and leucine-rich repeat protein GRR1